MSGEGLKAALPSAAEMAVCFREPSKRGAFLERIVRHYAGLRTAVPKPARKDEPVIRAYSRLMSRLRTEEQSVLEILDSFARGDAASVREAASRLTRL
ncbi:MAG: hypothetical protein ACC613_04105 [Synergistales bacterium]